MLVGIRGSRYEPYIETKKAFYEIQFLAWSSKQNVFLYFGIDVSQVNYILELQNYIKCSNL